MSAPEPVAPSVRAKWELLEILAVVILAAESLRIVGSVVAGIINGLNTLGGQQRVIGGAMETAANFSDGPGIVLLLLTLGMIWWRAEHWTGRLRRTLAAPAPDGGLPEEADQLHRLRELARWTTLLFLFACAGAVAYVVGNVLVVSAPGTVNSARWQAYSLDSFSVAYLLIAVAGLIGALKLTKLCDADLAQIDGAA
jgi:hypothetical protein